MIVMDEYVEILVVRADVREKNDDEIDMVDTL